MLYTHTHTHTHTQTDTHTHTLSHTLQVAEKVTQMQSALIREQKMKQLVSDITGQMQAVDHGFDAIQVCPLFVRCCVVVCLPWCMAV